MKMADAVQQLKAHWNDLANRCMRDNRPYFTDFLPAEDTAMAMFSEKEQEQFIDLSRRFTKNLTELIWQEPED